MIEMNSHDTKRKRFPHMDEQEMEIVRTTIVVYRRNFLFVSTMHLDAYPREQISDKIAVIQQSPS